jgi:hypothetical protein
MRVSDEQNSDQSLSIAFSDLFKSTADIAGHLGTRKLYLYDQVSDNLLEIWKTKCIGQNFLHIVYIRTREVVY